MQYPDTLEPCISYSKMIIIKILSMQEYGYPNSMRRMSNVRPPPGILYEYNY